MADPPPKTNPVYGPFQVTASLAFGGSSQISDVSTNAAGKPKRNGDCQPISAQTGKLKLADPAAHRIAGYLPIENKANQGNKKK